MVKQIKGVIFSESRETAFFTSLDWVRWQCREKLGFEAYPGTLNLRINEKDLSAISHLVAGQGCQATPPTLAFCEAMRLKVAIGAIEALAILPYVGDYYESTVEIIAPVKIKEKVNLTDGDEVVLTIDTLQDRQL